LYSEQTNPSNISPPYIMATPTTGSDQLRVQDAGLTKLRDEGTRKIESLKARCDALKTKGDELQASNDERNRRIEALKTKVDELETGVQAIKEELRMAEEKKSKAKEEFEKARESFYALMATIAVEEAAREKSSR
jgi:chromosome segregation ATPase